MDRKDLVLRLSIVIRDIQEVINDLNDEKSNPTQVSQIIGDLGHEMSRIEDKIYQEG